MRSRHAFADESARRGYLICAVVLAAGDLSAARQAMRALRKPGQRTIHMATEGGRRRREIISVVCRLGIESYLYEAPLTRRSQRRARDDCLRAAVPDLLACGVTRLVVESCDQDFDDRRIIYETVQKAQAAEKFSYLHDRPASEPLLWLPDVVAWAHGAGGDWRRRVRPIVAMRRRIEP